MIADSTESLYELLRDILLEYTPIEAAPLDTRLGPVERPRLYKVQAPDQREDDNDDGGYPYAVMRLSDLGGTPGERGLRHQMLMVVDVFDYPRENHLRAANLVDTLHQAVLHLIRADTYGLVFPRSSDIRRVEMPPAPMPMDRELVHIRLTVPLIVWPAYLTKASVT